jgi:hypothetical protein
MGVLSIYLHYVKKDNVQKVKFGSWALNFKTHSGGGGVQCSLHTAWEILKDFE